MVSVGISKLGCTDLVFVDPGVKINGAYYRDVLLSKQLPPMMREVPGVFRLSTGQRPSTPARTGSLVSKQPGLNPVHYRIWSVVQSREYQSRVHNTDELKQWVQQV